MMKTSLKKVLVGVVALVLILTSTMTSYCSFGWLYWKSAFIIRAKNCKEIFNSEGRRILSREITSQSGKIRRNRVKHCTI